MPYMLLTRTRNFQAGLPSCLLRFGWMLPGRFRSELAALTACGVALMSTSLKSVPRWWLKNLSLSVVPRAGLLFSVTLRLPVAAGCPVNGRSSSPSFNLELQSSPAILLGSDAYPHYVWIPTHAEPADDPTRDKPVRPPARMSPEWMIEQQSVTFDCWTHL